MRLKNILSLALLLLLFADTGLLLRPVLARSAQPNAITYYVSSSTGSDGNNGLSEGAPFATVGKVNSLNLGPGDRVLFKCGDTWRGPMLTISASGTAAQPITFGSYPAGCANKPILSGAQPIYGWAAYSGNIYMAQLNAGANAGRFGYGVNQLFRGETRLTLGRWPNLDAGDGGYSTIDGAGSNTITDNQLPPVSWNGAVAHIKGMRWYILNRQVTGTSGTTLTLGASNDCWGACTGWGYFLNNHLNTLDQDGEWYYDANAQRVYLYSTSGTPADTAIEASVIPVTGDDFNLAWGGINIGARFDDDIAYVTVENFQVQRWFRHGISIPTNFTYSEPHSVVVQNNIIRDVDGVGLSLATWVWNANDGRVPGWRGGYNMTISANLIERANRMGIDLYSRNSTFSYNIIRDVGRIANLGASGMGCAFNHGGGHCTEDGDGIRIKIDQANDTGNYNTFLGNRLERIGYSGFDVFGFNNTFTQNVILQACVSKGDCGGVRTFGRDSLGSSAVHNLAFNQNIIVDTIGNTDGCRSDFDDLFGFGLYIDNYSRDVSVTGNTIINSTVHGILFQNSTGSVTGNTLYNNGYTYPYGGGQVYLGDSPAALSSHTGNILYSLDTDAWTLALADPSRLGTSNNNYFFSPYKANHISASGAKSLAAWRSFSGKDGASVEHWFTLPPGDPPNSQIFYNDTGAAKVFNLGTTVYKDLDQNLVWGSLTVQPFQSRILVVSGESADLELTMAISAGQSTVPGAPVEYTLTLRNQGTLAADGVTLTHLVPAEIINTAWQAVPATVTLQGGTRYVWNIASIPPGGEYVFTVTGEYDGSLVAGTPLALVGEAATTSPEVDTGDNRDILWVGDALRLLLPLVWR